MKELQTDQLRLRPLSLEDLPFFVQLHADERVARHLGTGRPRSEVETRDWLAKTLAWHSQERLGHLGVILKHEERLIGRCGLTCFEVELDAPQPRAFWGRGSAPEGVRTSPILEVGYAFHPDAWRRGYATEAAGLMRDEAFAVRGEMRIISIIHEENVGSIRVAEKNGLLHRGTLDVFGRSFRRYELTRPEWERFYART